MNVCVSVCTMPEKHKAIIVTRIRYKLMIGSIKCKSQGLNKPVSIASF